MPALRAGRTRQKGECNRVNQQKISMKKTKAELEQDLATFEAWSDALPLKSVMLSLTRRDLYLLAEAEQSQERARVAAQRAAERAAMPFWRRLLA